MKKIAVILPLLFAFAFRADQNPPYVKINGKKQYFTIMGDGQPAIVFITGMGVPMQDMYGLQERLSQITRTFNYDRAGLGKSENLSEDRSLPMLCEELKDMLEKTYFTKKFILVGHSRGALMARYFANKYPSKVLGLMLIDPAVPEIKAQLRSLRTKEENAKADSTFYVDFTMESTVPAATKNEMKCYPKADSALMSTIPLPKNIPITILSSVKITEDKHSQQDAAIKALFLQNMISEVPKAKLVLTEKSGHIIYIDEPALVTVEIANLIRALQSK